MKSAGHDTKCGSPASLPVRGAWVEIALALVKSHKRQESLPVRGAWVEIGKASSQWNGYNVAPRAGSVG